MQQANRLFAFRPDIEGLRGIAILMVVAFHCGLSGVPGGFAGVDVFFVLSGYVITRLLVREFESSGRISLLEFYARRIRRLLPAAAVTLLATVLVGALILAPNEMLFMARAARAMAVYASNFFFALNASDYFSPDVEVNPLLHTWSLAVEEQYYLFWPIIMLLCLRTWRSEIGLVTILAILSAISLFVSVEFTDRMGTFAFYTLPTRVWQFGFGALVSLVPTGRIRLSRGAWLALGWLGVGTVIGSAVFITERMSFPGWVAVVPCLGTGVALLAGAEGSERGAARLLATAPMQYLGKVSYSWYLWHWPFVVYTEALLPNVSAVGKTVAGLAALAASAVTHHFIENPVRFNAVLMRRSRLVVGLGAVVTVVSLAVSTYAARFAVQLGEEPEMRAITAAVDDTGRLSRQECVSSPETTEVKICEFGAAGSATQLVLFGDSHAMQWFNPVQRIAERQGWRLTTIVKSGCPSVDLRPPSHSALALANCRVWQKQALARAIAMRPAAVFISNATGHFGTATHVASHVEFDDSFDELRDGTRRTLQQFSAAGIPVVLMRDIPRLGFDVPTCHARSTRHAWYPGGGCPLDKSRAVIPEVFAAEQAAAEGLPNVYFIDLIDHLCDAKICPTKLGNSVMYRDNHHITATYAESFASEIESALLADVAALRQKH